MEVRVAVALAEGVSDGVHVWVAVRDGDGVRVLVDVRVLVAVFVTVGVCEAVGVGAAGGPYSSICTTTNGSE